MSKNVHLLYLSGFCSCLNDVIGSWVDTVHCTAKSPCALGLTGFLNLLGLGLDFKSIAIASIGISSKQILNISFLLSLCPIVNIYLRQYPACRL